MRKMGICRPVPGRKRFKAWALCVILWICYVASNFVWNWPLFSLQRAESFKANLSFSYPSADFSNRELLSAQQCQQKPQVNCSDAFRSDIPAERRISTENHTKTSKYNPCDLLSLGTNCTAMRITLGYPNTTFSKTEDDFSIAYSIRMHKDPEQVEMLLRAIYAPQNVYCIYIDRKSPPEVHAAMHYLSQCLPNVFIASQLKPFYYATSSQMNADLQCMRDLLDTSVPWKYYLNLAGQEFPLRTNREIVEILTLLNGTNDIEVGKYVRGLRWRYLSRVIPDVEQGFRFDGQKRDKLGLNVTLFKGSAYGAFSRRFVQFLLLDRRAQRLRHWLADTFAPEETFFATANAMSGAPGGYPVYVNQKAGEHISRSVLWEGMKYPPCHGVYVRGVCIMSSKDLSWLVKRPQMFANKFDINVDKSAVQCLLHNILFRRTEQPVIDLSYFYSLPHVNYALRRHLQKSVTN